jgi:spore coat protein CotH
MDEFEETYPEIKNQRFYGFKKLTFGSGFSDNSLMREVIATELFRSAGVPVARVAYYRVYIDYGEGSKYFGLYTMIEDPDGPMLKTQFKSNKGNLYKPDGTGATLASFDQESLVKKTNEDKQDWSDTKAFIAALHADRTDAKTWRTNLEKLFNVDGFLRWIAMANLMVHWDTYGSMTHNYYLYTDPGDDGRMHWITWDHNMVMMNMGGGGGGGGGGRSATELGLPNVNADQWPLLGYLIADPEYRKTYNKYVAEFAKGPFATDTVVKRLTELHTMIAPYVVGEQGEQKGYTMLSNAAAFNSAVDDLKKHIETRQQAAADYLKTQ